MSHSDISKMKPVSTVRKSHGHHRNMNALKDPEELERIEKAKNKRIQVEKGKKRHKHFKPVRKFDQEYGILKSFQTMFRTGTTDRRTKKNQT